MEVKYPKVGIPYLSLTRKKQTSKTKNVEMCQLFDQNWV